jgi:hypothetical protein
MIAAVESALARAPDSRWSEFALFLAGNYYWVQLDRDRAAAYYKRLSDNFPNAADALAAQWRFTWAAILKRQPEDPRILPSICAALPARNSRQTHCTGSAAYPRKQGTPHSRALTTPS